MTTYTFLIEDRIVGMIRQFHVTYLNNKMINWAFA